MTVDQFDDELQRLLAVDPSPDFIARVRMAVARELVRSPFHRRVLTFVAVSVTVGVVIGFALSFREPPIPDSITPPTFVGIDIPLPPVHPEDSAGPTTRIARHHRPTERASGPELVPPVIISPEDRQAFQRLVRYVNEQPLILSFEEATSQRTSNESLPEEGVVQ